MFALPIARHVNRSARKVLAAVLVAAFLCSSLFGVATAATTGTINGVVTDSSTGKPLAGVQVTAVSPSSRYTATTNAQGFYAFTGVNTDTYTIGFELTKYQPFSTSGVNVSGDSVSSINAKLSQQLSEIGRVTARSSTSAFQPKQVQDTYTVNTAQIQTILGKSDAISETNLLTRLPGASLDRYGYPVLRGGRENEEGFQFDGIDYVDAFTSQFTNSLALNLGVGQLQLTPGAGDASVGNTGTGTINLIAKRGAYPGYGSVDVETLLQPFLHQFGFEYGFSTPNGRISNYVQFTGYNAESQFGQRGSTPAATYSLGTFFDPSYNTSRSVLDNFIVKFGKNNNQSLQILYDNQQSNFLSTYGGSATLAYAGGDPYFTTFLAQNVGITPAQTGSLIYKFPYAPSTTAPLGNRGATNYYQPNNVLKFQYSNNLDASTFLNVKYYQLDSVVTFDFPNDDQNLIPQDIYLLQGGHRTGGAIDLSKAVNEKNLVQVGAKFDFLHPVYDQTSPSVGLAATSGFNNGFESSDFVSASAANCPVQTATGGAGSCGYLYKYFPNGPGPVPYNSEQSVTNRQDWAAYIRDKITPNDKLVIDAGIRLEGTNYQLPGLNGCNPSSFTAWQLNDQCQYLPTGFKLDSTGTAYPYTNLTNDQKHPVVFEPRLGFSYQLTPNDAIRANYGRSVEFAALAFIDLVSPLGQFAAFNNIPSYNNLTGKPATYCGVLSNLPCQNYADQLHWENQNYFEGVPIQPVKPETFNNWEASYSHQFPHNVALRVTPFYRRGYDALALVASPRLDSKGNQIIDPASGNVILGPATATNLGTNRTTGVELYVTKDALYGLSGSLAATYINEFSNVVPSPLITEDFFPPIPTPSLQLGNQYRVGFISPLSATLAVQYKTHNGIRVNPIFTFFDGFPAGVGNITAVYVNGQPVNVPNTNAFNYYGTNFTPNFVDPQNPGSAFHPNIDATRGTKETASAAGFLSNARVFTNVALEYTAPGSRSTFGVLFTNLFNNTISNLPTYNSRYQPVATGIDGPKTGLSTAPILYPGQGFGQYGLSQTGNQAYRYNNNATPQTIRLYFQQSL